MKVKIGGFLIQEIELEVTDDMRTTFSVIDNVLKVKIDSGRVESRKESIKQEEQFQKTPGTSLEEQEVSSKISEVFCETPKDFSDNSKKPEEKYVITNVPLVFRSEAKREELRKRYFEDNETYSELAKAFGVSESTLSNALRILGFTGQKKAKRIKGSKFFNTPEKIELLKNLYNSKMKIEKIASHFGCSVSTVYDEVERQKLPKRRKIVSVDKNEVADKKAEDSGINEKVVTPSIKPSSCENTSLTEENSKKFYSTLKVFEKAMTEEDRKEILRLYREELKSVKEIAFKYKTKKRVMQQFLKVNLGIALRDERHEVMCRAEHLKENEKKVLMESISKGLEDEEIKKIVDVTQEQLRYYRTQYQKRMYA